MRIKNNKAKNRFTFLNIAVKKVNFHVQKNFI